MRKFIAAVAVTLSLIGLIAVPASAAYPPPIPGCQTVGVVGSDPPWWYTYAPDIDGWRGGSFRVSADCGRVINYDSRGQANGEPCSMARVNYRYINLTTPWVVVCRLQTARLHGMAPINESFYIETRDIHAAHRQRSDRHSLFILEF